LKQAAIERLDGSDTALVADYFESGPAYPAILVDAVSHWPALSKWNLEFFSTHFRGDLGIASLRFDRTRAGKATKLGTFIDHLDEPYDSLPGLWIGTRDAAAAEAEFDERATWAFNWDAFRLHPALREDIAPHPASIPNLVARLPLETADVLEQISSVKFHAIYISRKDTITPLHTDFHHTIGSLVQFVGDKTVILFEPDAYARSDALFDPEHPDFGLFPAMRDATAHTGVLKPGEMVIIPPDWWHYTRSHDHSVTLSHNFFTPRNRAAFLRCIVEDMERNPEKEALFEQIECALE
jgi:hypothetical protein